MSAMRGRQEGPQAPGREGGRLAGGTGATGAGARARRSPSPTPPGDASPAPYRLRPGVIFRLNLKLAIFRVAVVGLGGRAPALSEPLLLLPLGHGSRRPRSGRRALAGRHEGASFGLRKWAASSGRTNRSAVGGSGRVYAGSVRAPVCRPGGLHIYPQLALAALLVALQDSAVSGTGVLPPSRGANGPARIRLDAAGCWLLNAHAQHASLDLTSRPESLCAVSGQPELPGVPGPWAFVVAR